MARAVRMVIEGLLTTVDPEEVEETRSLSCPLRRLGSVVMKEEEESLRVMISLPLPVWEDGEQREEVD